MATPVRHSPSIIIYSCEIPYIMEYFFLQKISADSPQLSRINCEILNLHCIIFIDILAVDKTIQKQTPGIQFSKIVPIDFTLCFSIYFASPASEASQKIKVIMRLKFHSTCHSCYSHHSWKNAKSYFYLFCHDNFVRCQRIISNPDTAWIDSF
jgi:hypothetical protein